MDEELNIPYDDELELTLLSEIIGFKDAVGIVAGHISQEDFFNTKYAVMYNSAYELYKEGQSIDYHKIANKLRELGVLEFVGGTKEIIRISKLSNENSEIETHAAILKQLSMQRSLIMKADELSKKAGLNLGDAITVIKDINEVINIKSTESHSIETLIDEIDNYKDEVIEMPSGSRALDSIIGGFKRGSVITVAGRPAMGKTSLALGLFNKTLMSYNKHGVVWSLEMPPIQIVMWMIQANGLSKEKIQRKDFTQEELIVYNRAKATILSSGIKFIDSIPFEDFLIKIKQLAATGLDYLIIDYIQNIQTRQKFQNENAKIEYMMVELKNLAIKLDIPIILLSQLNREVEARTDKRPKPSDLRSSGALEQSSDVILFPFRAEEYASKSEFMISGDATYDNGIPIKGVMELIVAKNKDGNKGRVFLEYSEDVKRFNDYNMSSINQGFYQSQNF